MKVIDYKKVNINKIIYKEPIKTVGGCLLSRTFYSYNDEEIPIYIQTPRLKNTSNLVVNDSKTYLELELDKKHINFYEFINNIDDQNITKTHNRSEDWFNQKLPMDVIDDFYKTNIKMRKYNKAPIIKFKIPLYKNKNKKGCDIFGDDLQPIDISEIKKDLEVICILELQGIKFFKQRFETEWKVVQLRAYLNKNISPRECLINEEFLSDIEETESVEEEGLKMIIEDQDNNENKNENIKSIEIEAKPKVENTINEIIKVENNSPVTEEIINLESSDDPVEEESITKNEEEVEVAEKNESLESDSSDVEEEPTPDSDSENETEELNDYYSDNFSDEEEICEGLENNLEEIDFVELNDSHSENLESEGESEIESEVEDEVESKETKSESVDLSHDKSETDNLNPEEVAQNIKDLNKESEEIKYEDKNIDELIAEINKLKKLAFEKDEEVSKLKSKYRNLYSELNL